MAPDSFEPDHLAAEVDAGGEAEVMSAEPRPAAPPRARRSLFQIVCLEPGAGTPAGKGAV